MEINTRNYYLAHGKEPRGRGHWAFFFDGEDSALWHNGLYAEALKYAKAYAVAKGHSQIEVGS